MIEQCNFYTATHQRCPSRETRWIEDASRNLCKEHHIRCGRSNSEWEQATPKQAIADDQK